MNFFNHCCKKCSQQESNPQLVLSRRLLYPFNYGNKCHIFGLFQPFSVTATNFMNSITFVMNHLISYFDISICHCSNRTLCYHLFKFHGFNYGYFLGEPRYIHLTTRTNAVFSSFSACFGYGDLLYELNHFRDESSDFLFRHFYMLLFQSDSLLPLFRFHGFNHGCFLEVTPIRFVTQKTVP